MGKILFITVVSLLLFGCVSVEDACESITCEDREECSGGECFLKEGYCNQNTDCDGNLYCNLSFECVDEITLCNSLKCDEWEVCDPVNSSCKLDHHRCNSNDHCFDGNVCKGIMLRT